jgi:ABC-2 type transport system ATP-binding protein
MDPPGIQEMRALIRSLADRRRRDRRPGQPPVARGPARLRPRGHHEQGQAGAEGAVSELTAGGERLRLIGTPIEKVLAALSVNATRDGEAVLAEIKRTEGPALIRALVEQGVDIHEAKWVGADLESIFFNETGAVQEADNAR